MALYVAMFGVLLLVLTVFDQPIVAVILAIVVSYYGWQALSKITPNFFLIMPIGAWVAYYVVKGVLAFFLGVFVAPFIIGKRIALKISNTLANSIDDAP